MTLEEFQKIVNDKWQELEDIAGRGVTTADESRDFCSHDEFNIFLKTNNIGRLTYDDHWGEGGAYDFIDELIGIIHDHENRCFIIKDPSAGDWVAYLILKVKNE